MSSTVATNSLIEKFHRVREFSESLAEPLSAEDCGIQSMPDASPTRWHLAHTTWFFETFLLKHLPGYEAFHPDFELLFNSYYNSVGEPFPRSQRGLISRPGLDETLQYRRHVDEAVKTFYAGEQEDPETRRILEIGLQHEQQHQELILTDIKHALSINPLKPAYGADGNLAERPGYSSKPPEKQWRSFEGGIVEIGHGSQDFCFDNELPRHKVYLRPFSIANRCVTNGEFLKFINEGGYGRPEFWLSAGWTTRQQHDWTAPMYWEKRSGVWWRFTLDGLQKVVDDDPVCHVSYFEADAYARWAGHRLVTEFEWEHAVETDQSDNQNSLVSSTGDVWEWTSSQYSAYPGYQPVDGALGEYNGKFMCNQFVLRGGSFATPRGHIRATYRNFFPPDARWQFNGIRLAK